MKLSKILNRIWNHLQQGECHDHDDLTIPQIAMICSITVAINIYLRKTIAPRFEQGRIDVVERREIVSVDNSVIIENSEFICIYLNLSSENMFMTTKKCYLCVSNFKYVFPQICALSVDLIG